MLFNKRTADSRFSRRLAAHVGMEPARGRQRRVFSVAARLGFWLIIAGAVFSSAWALSHAAFRVFFADNPHFILKRVRIDTWSSIAKVQVEAILRKHGVVPRASNLFAFDLSEIRTALERQLIIDTAMIRRELPDCIVVEITEREPVAQWKKPGGRLLDEDGWVLPRLDTAEASSLPVVTGGRQDRADRVGVQVKDSLVHAALRLLHFISLDPWYRRFEISLIQLDYVHRQLRVHMRPGSTFRPGAEVVFPPDNLPVALQRANAIIRARARAGQTISFMDVTYQRNVPVRP